MVETSHPFLFTSVLSWAKVFPKESRRDKDSYNYIKAMPHFLVLSSPLPPKKKLFFDLRQNGPGHAYYVHPK